MAPLIYPRQFHSFPPPRPPKGPPGTPVMVTRYISFDVFVRLLVGTVCIFIIGVLAWKVGKLLRFLSRDNVVREGRSPYTRYARTWYGWVPQSRHEANKRVFRNAYEKYKRCTAWKSTHTDYAWVWWDPGQRGQMAYYEDRRRPLRWVPKCFRSYEPTAADTIWNPGPPPAPAALSEDSLPGRSAGLTTIPSGDGVNSTSDSLPVLSGMHDRYNRRRQKEPRSRFSSIWADGQGYTSDNNLAQRRNRWTQRSQLFLENSRLFWDLNHAGRSSRENVLRGLSGCDPAMKWSASVPCLASTAVRHKSPVRRSDTSWESEPAAERDIAQAAVTRRRSRKYQVWSTWMQVQPSGLIKHKQGGAAGPPGTPRTEFLASLISVQRAFLESLPVLPESRDNTPSQTSDHAPPSLGTDYITPRSTATSDSESMVGRCSSTPFLCSQATSLSSAGNALVRHGLHSLRNLERLGSFTHLPPNPKPQETKKHGKHRIQVMAVRSRIWNPVPPERLSDWEVRLVDNLDRKLQWFLQEVEPGRRPFHFATLANHWLNKKTWMVLDPASRTPIDARREHGDPRFNVPYPARTYGPKPKYPAVPRRQAHTPRTNSWRAAVNRQRKASGLRDFIKVVELFDGSSADEPPDGKIDPASWVLRKPPQGFSMPTKQQNAYYDGVTGWQETLSDWQKVRRGYRVRKIVHDGRVNRNRVKDLARGIAGRYQTSLPRSSTG